MKKAGVYNQVRVLMLGWEYPPRFAGGLGKACQGLAQGLARRGAQIYFVLPSFPEPYYENRLEVVGAKESVKKPLQDFVLIAGGAQLYPYGAAPDGPMPKSWSAFSSSQIPQLQGGVALSPKKTEIYGKNLWSEIERFAATVRHLADTHEVDVVHAHDWMTFPAAFEYQRLTGTPVFLHIHATEYDRSGENLSSQVFQIEKEGFRKATHLFVVSRYTAGILERLYGVNRRKITVIYNAPEERFKQLEPGAIRAIRKDQVVFLGRLTFQKGPDHFLFAAALVAKANARARFIFCGSGDMLDQLRDQAYRLGIEDRVHFTGFIDPPAVDEVLLSSRVLVMPSVSEPFGLVALEAIHCGIPIIISKQSGVREVLPRALQVDFWDHERLADQILASLRLPDLSGQLVDEGLQQMRNLSWDKSAERVIRTYHQNLGSTYGQAIEGAHGH